MSVKTNNANLATVQHDGVVILQPHQPKSLASEIFFRLMRNKGAVAGLLIILLSLLMATMAPVLSPYPIDQMNMDQRLQGPSATYLLGTDEFGRDLLSRVLHGMRVSMLMGTISVLVAGVIGVVLGILSGYYRRLDLVIMLVTDMMFAFPSMLLAIAIVAILGAGLGNATIAVAIAVIPYYVRQVRASVLAIKEKEFVEAVRALGMSDAKILFSHILPNIWAPIIVLSTIQFGGSIMAAAGLSFLGLGAQPPIPELGTMSYAGITFMSQAWWLSVVPGVVILLIVLGFNLLGDGLRDALDPKQ